MVIHRGDNSKNITQDRNSAMYYVLWPQL